ncbi:MAG: ABC transporter ATP-binding protein [Chloroflexi bacterium]|nr:ABC transporter ATP-binding protein [Chloroflexota bacterium]
MTDVGRVFEGAVGDVIALEDVHLTIAPGELISLVGPSGCGKSTLLRAVAGLDTDYSGEILADGQPVHGPDLTRGIIFQEPRLFPWLNLWENVGFGLRTAGAERKQRIGELIQLVGLAGFEQAYPHQLSGGMAQRAAIARALAPSPGVLLLDEPFGALDAFTRMRLQDAFQDIWLAQRTTAILVTHDIEEAIDLGQRVVVMTPRPGRVRRVVEIDLPYPRDRGTEQFAAYRREILAEFDLSHAGAAHAV